MNREGVLVIGSANMDMVVSAKRFPNPGETLLGTKFEMFPGGKGANQSVSCARLGGKTYFIGKMGNDEFQRKLSSNLAENGVNLDHLFIDEKESTGIALITVDGSGQNEIIVISGSNMKLSPSDINNNKEIFSKVKVILTQLEIPIESVIEAALIAKEYNIPFILNPAPARKLPNELFSLLDFITPNESELEFLTGIKIIDEPSAIKGATALLKHGVKNVVVTLGKLGALYVNENTSVMSPANNVNVVDTTGAGDAFNGAFAYYLSEGLAIEKVLKYANVVASLSVTKMGAQSSMPIRSELPQEILAP
ncbi:MAG: ribokinase [Ignavibacteriaceae bacterium]